jgi:hypothetical protein
MAAMRGILTDPAGTAAVSVAGTIESTGGELEFADTDEILQAALAGRTFRLTTADGTELDIKLSEVTPGSNPGTSRAAFTAV